MLTAFRSMSFALSVCNHPLLFHPWMRNQHGATLFGVDETMIKICGKFSLLDQILHKLKATGHKVLIFNQMTKVMDVLEHYCHLRNFTYLRLDGNTSADVRTEAVQKFNAPDSPYFLFMLSTRGECEGYIRSVGWMRVVVIQTTHICLSCCSSLAFSLSSGWSWLESASSRHSHSVRF